jgi:hypothetical protein
MKEYWAIDGFFRAILEDLFAIRRDMATKDDIRQIREEMANLATRTVLREVRDDVRRLTDMMVSKADLKVAPSRVKPCLAGRPRMAILA